MRLAKGFKGRYFSLAAIAATVSCVQLQATENSVHANERQIVQYGDKDSEENAETLEEIEVLSVDTPVSERKAPFTTEIYTEKEIRNSHSVDLYQFLNDHTSVTVSSSYGNRFSPKLDMRGYGLENGYQNIVVTVDGRRLNNIDMSGPLLASVPLETIERIEIIKGAGSIEAGDGANAGVINIVTKRRSGLTLKGYWGDYGERYGMVAGGLRGDYADFDFFLDRYANGGMIRSDTGEGKDAQKSVTGRFDVALHPVEWTSLSFGYLDNGDDIRYAGPVDKTTYEDDIKKPRTLTHQRFDSKLYSYGLTLVPRDDLDVELRWFQEAKRSEYVDYASVSDYWYNTFTAKVHYDAPWAAVTLGYDAFDGIRRNFSGDMSKENDAWYVKLDKSVGPHTFTAGYRRETVDYLYDSATQRLDSDDSEHAWNIGYNYAFNREWSGYVSYNRAYQTPDIDRFFTYDFTTYQYRFNEFIDPMTSKTLDLGVNYFTASDKLKLSLFYIEVDDEIYYTGGWTGINTNLDETSRKGVEIYAKHLFGHGFWGSVNYTYVDAKIEKEENHPEYEGKRLPGVSKHNAVIALGYRSSEGFAATLTHTYRSSAYAFEDFANDFSQKQETYNLTNLALSYRYGNLELFANVTNLFDESNGIWIHDDAIYAVDYARTYRFGLKASY